jgi:endonuclease/exonuclease/phosphatase family metal-dependent hydrolase
MKALMKLVALLLVVALVVVFFYVPHYFLTDATVELSDESDGSITIMSTNVRFYNPLDLLKQSWFYRASLIVEDVNSVKPDIIGFQEATFIHYDYLKNAMPDYSSEMAYRDNFVLSEGCPIFYRTDKFELIDSGSFWLSETPEIMSKDWGSEHYRICVYVILREIESGTEFAVFNTHLDHVSDEARINGIKVVLDKISAFGDLPAVLMGDLNAKEDSETIESAFESFDDGMKNAPITTDAPTYHNWGNFDAAKRIDYILTSKGDATVSEYHVLDNCHDGVYSSDHASIFVKLTFNTTHAFQD